MIYLEHFKMRLRLIFNATVHNWSSLEIVVSFNSCLIDHALDKFKNFCRDAKMKLLHWKNNFPAKFLKDDKIEAFHVIYDFEESKNKTNTENHLIISKVEGLLQLSWLQRERGVAFLALSNSVPRTLSGAMVAAGRARRRLEGPPSICGALFVGGLWQVRTGTPWMLSAGMEPPTTGWSSPDPAWELSPAGQRRASSSAAALLIRTSCPASALPWCPVFAGWGEQREEPVQHAAIVLPGWVMGRVGTGILSLCRKQCQALPLSSPSLSEVVLFVGW